LTAALLISGASLLSAQIIQGDKKLGTFSSMDISGTVGTTGLGLELSTPLIKDALHVRAGFSIMPHFDYNIEFGMETEADKGNAAAQNFEKLSSYLKGLTGLVVDDHVDVVGTPNLWNAHILFDIYPLRNKHWYLSAGLFFGSSRIASAMNSINDASTLVAVSMYNSMYIRAMADEPLISLGNSDIYASTSQIESFKKYGRMGVYMGDRKSDGTAVMFEPDENCIMKVDANVNPVKPYVGVGYTGRLAKNNDRWKIGVDAGVLFWGGKPSMIIKNPIRDDVNGTITGYEEIDLARDVDNLQGKVKNYVNLMSAFVVYPVINAKISYTLFKK